MSILDKIFPSKHSRWRTIAVFLLAVFIGLAAFTAKESEVISYMSDDPLACVNCHVMTPVYNSWMHSSHRERASCNDCHVPHNNVVNKYFFKAKDGLYHASVFTARAEPEVIFMREESQKVVQANCVRCHIQQVTETRYAGWLASHTEDRTGRTCWSCHREVPHGKVHGLSTVRYNIAPIPTNTEEMVIPEWIKEATTK
ncbi:cytochrome c nitrite reductase small subunit [Robertkochia solimangrovi]|uniref:cytochrome c nitrite reductase small subunit n=1 Tax=Robertkochia solimangrovi TaxID=2213046 RepID=UPI00117C64C9|nr:cytochrome c nitrite reductase small subunit [Robertkochia solimangrovi]TRZ42034.1 cytochrome c nitrite reductase small subunit [Robertkochia solimangrovi]